MSLQSDLREDGEGNSDSSEAKTDRYGFLLVNGDTNNDSDEPCPELVRHREMKWINLMSQWDQVLEKKHKIKGQCQKGIPASVRSKCWPLLCGAQQRKENNKDLYKTLESSPGQQSWIDVITRDTDRQFPFHEMFQSKDSHGQQGLLKVLKAYTQFRPDEGYCQAQGPVAAVLLMNMPIEEAFWCLVQISELYLPGYYSPLLEGVLFDAAVLFGVLKRTCPAAYKHMQSQGVEPLMFATDWLMCLYSRHLPFNTLLRVWDLFFCNGVRVLFQVAVVLVRRCLGEARQRKECEGQMETLERLRSVRGRVQHVQADTFIQEVCSVPLSLAEIQRQTEKELEKWRKERPGSTFDPRDRCHGYYMIWEKGKEREKENGKREKQSVGLSASLIRSHSSLSPAILRKKWRKRGSKAETEDWEGRGFSKQDSDDEEKRRASVCGVAGELQAKTHNTSQGCSPHLNKERNTTMNAQHVSATEPQPSSESSNQSVTVFEEDENGADSTTALSHRVTVERKETRLPSSMKDDSQTGNSQQETENQHGTETCQDEEMKVQTPRHDQGAEILTLQDQPQGEIQQEQPQSIQQEEDKDARTKLEEATQENTSKQEEEMEINTCNTEPNISTQEEGVNITQQEVDDAQEKEIQICTSEQEQENGKNSKHEEEIQTDSSKQEEEIETNIEEQQEEIHRVSTEEEVEIQEEKEIMTKSHEQEMEIQEEGELDTKGSEQDLEIQEEKEFDTKVIEQEEEIQEEKEIMTKPSEQEVEILEERELDTKGSEQEVENQKEKELDTKGSEQEVEIQEEKEIKTKTNEQEVEILEEKELDTKVSEQEVEIHKEKVIQANSSEPELEIPDEDKVTNRDNEEQKRTVCLIKEDVSKHEQQQQEDSDQNEMEEETSSNVQIPEAQKGIELGASSVQEEAHMIEEFSESGSHTDVENAQQEQEGEREHSEDTEEVIQISAIPLEETKEAVMEEGKRRCDNSTGDREEPETLCVQQEITIEHSGESETPQDSSQTQEENMEVSRISTPEHEEPDRTSRSSSPQSEHPKKKEEEVEREINTANESNLVKPSPSSSTPIPQLRLRRSSTTHTSYPTILSEDTFRDPQHCSKQESCPQTTKAEDSDVTQATQTQSSQPEDPQMHDLPMQSKSEKPKRRGLFHRLRADTPSKAAIPKIVIQDFSEGDEKLTSKERRRRRRMQERKEKEEQKERKKLEKAEKGREKERERKKPQTRGKSFQVLSGKHGDVDDVFSGTSDSQVVGRKRNSYSESFF